MVPSTVTRNVLWRKVLNCQTRVYCYCWEVMPSGNLSFMNFAWITFWDLNPEVWDRFGGRTLRLGWGDHFGWRWKADRASCKLYPDICLTIEGKRGKLLSGWPSRLLVASTWLSSETWHRPACWVSVQHGYTCGSSANLWSAQVPPICRTKRFPASANFELSLSAITMIWSSRNGIPRSSWTCLLPAYKGALVT
jgi:hypothetical protein